MFENLYKQAVEIIMHAGLEPQQALELLVDLELELWAVETGDEFDEICRRYMEAAGALAAER
jgi:hypothetical protein